MDDKVLLDFMTRYVDRVCLGKTVLEQYPDELSGGEKRRVCIARALAVQPKLIVADEPLTGLDFSLRNRIIRLLLEENRKRRISFLLISHDIGTIAYVATKIAVMYLGRLVEIGPSDKVLSMAGNIHPYTYGLLSASQYLGVLPGNGNEKARKYLSSDSPEKQERGSIWLGCVFRDRCYIYRERLKRWERECCDWYEPHLQQVSRDHQVACHYSHYVC